MSRWITDYKLWLSKEYDPSQKRDVLGMILKCMWWWGSSCGDLKIAEHPITTINQSSIWNRSGSDI